MRPDIKRCTLIGVVIPLLSACAARKPGEPLTPGFNMYSRQDDIEIGRQAAQTVRSEVDVVQDQQLQDYIGSLGRRLAQQPQAGDYPYSFTLIRDDSVNAFALPGGPVFINTGTMAAAENEAQLVGVIAHEIAHVALRHGTSQASKANLTTIPAVLAGSVIGDQSVAAQIGQAGLAVGVNSVLLKYSRDAEREADALGAHLMAEAGYNPLEMAHFFEKLEASGGASAPAFLSSHPSPGNRVRNVEAELATMPARNYNAGTGKFAAMQRRLP